MKILIILPNWLGDAVMATPAIELLCKYYPKAKLTFIGSLVSIEALKYHPNCENAIIDETKKAPNRIKATYDLANKVGSFDMAISFRDQIHASLLLKLTKSVICIAKKSWHSMFLLSHTPTIKADKHLSIQYAQLAMTNTDAWDISTPNLKLYIEPKKFEKQTMGINAGATYGSAKRWYPERFAEVARKFSDKYEIIIFGGPNEVEMANEIESYLKVSNVTNYTNLAGKTNIKELCSLIGGCSLFVTNDSGPMHVAAAYKVPTISIFGPTKHTETSQWMNEKSTIVKHDIECAPCMRRECPLKHHDCMKGITSSEVIQAVKELNL